MLWSEFVFEVHVCPPIAWKADGGIFTGTYEILVKGAEDVPRW